MSKTYYKIYKNENGNVGIGTTSADYKLTVLAGSGDEIRFYRNPTAYLKFGFGTSNAAIYSGGDIQFLANGSTVNSLIINSSLITLNEHTYVNGNLGIGTTSPTRKLHIDGGSASSTSIYIDANSINGTDIEQSANDFRFQVRDNIPLLFFTNNSEKVRIAANGNVGIGTTTPLTDLDVRNNIGVYGANSSTSGQIYLGSSDFTNSGYFNSAPGIGAIISTGNSQTDGLGFYTYTGASNSRTEKMRIEDDGKVGIGTTSPASLLHVSNSAASGGTFKFTDGSSRTLTDLSGGILSWTAGSVFGAGSWAGTADHEFQTLGTARDTVLINGPASGTNHALYVTGLKSYFAGNVGIGTTNTSTAKLYVLGGASSQTFSTGADELVVEGSDHAGISILAAAAKRAQLYFNTDAFLRWVDNDGVLSIDTSSSSSKIAIGSSGANVGIGTTSPTKKLHVDGDTLIDGDLTVSGQTLFLSASYVNITSSNVNIGDNIIKLNAQSPFKKYAGIEMNDSGSSAVAQFLWDSEGNYFFVSGSTATNSQNQILLGPDNKNDLSAGYLPVSYNTNELSSSIIYQGGNNIGIGTSTPDRKLQVNSGGTNIGIAVKSTDAGSYIAFEDNTTTNNATVYLGARGDYLELRGSKVGINTTSPTHGVTLGDISSNVATGRELVFYRQSSDINTGYDSTLAIYSKTNSFGSYEGAHFRARGFKFQKHDGSIEYLTINQDGNVGIGTTSPSAKLHIGSAFSDAASDLSTAALAIKQSSNDAQNGIYIERSGERKGYYIGIAGSLDGLTFKRNFSGTKSDIMTLTRDGNVGIGTTNPSNKLQVVGGATSVNLAVIGAGEFSSNDFGTTFKTTNTNQKRSQIFFKDSADVITARLGNDIEGSNNAKLQFIAGSGSTPHMSILSGGNVGIGTASPDSKLVVSGDLRVLGVNHGNSKFGMIGIRKQDGTNALGGIGMHFDTGYENPIIYGYNAGSGYADGNIRFSSMGTGDRSLDTGLTDRMVINMYTGNVGIGTTSPNNILHIKNADPVIRLEDSSPDGVYGLIDAGGGALHISADGGAGSANSFISFRVDGTAVVSEKMRITSDGNVGIGTTSPEAKLHVLGADASVAPDTTADIAAFEFSAGAGVDGVSLLFPDDKAGQLVFGTPSDNLAGRIVYTGPSVATAANQDSMRFYTSGSQQAIINKDGNVGIGITSPASLLHLYGASGATGEIRLESSNGKAFTIGSTGTAYGSANNLIIYDIGASAERMRITSAGDVGIGTNTVSSYGAGYTTLDIRGSTGSGIKYGNSTDVSYLYANSTATYLRTGTYKDLVLGTFDTERMRITSGGNVGIGTSSPAQLFHAHKTSGNNAIYLTTDANTSGSSKTALWFAHDYTSSADWAGIIFDADDKLRITNGSSSSGTDIVIDSSNRVGIGTASPSYKLQVVGDIRISTGDCFLDDTRSIKWGGNDAKIDGSSGGDYLRFYTNGSERMRIISGGNVGIGTTSPDALLHLESSSTSACILRLESTATDGYPSVRFLNDVAEWRIYGADGSQSDSFVIHGGLNGSLTSRLVVNTDGNVGIGTASPGTRLEVNGILTIDTDWQPSQGVGGLGLGDYNTGGYKWIQSYNSHPLSINPLGNNVGIGTASPSNPLTVVGAESVSIDDYIVHNGDSDTKFGFPVNDTFKIRTAGTDRLYINSSGNVGIGTTGPSFSAVSGNTAKGLEIANIGNDTQASLRLTGHNNTGTPGQATYTELKHAGGNLRFDIDHNGTTALSINPDGNVGIGTTSPSAKLDIGGVLNDPPTIRLTNTTTSVSLGDSLGEIQFYNSDATDFTPGVFGMIRGVAHASGGEGSIQILTDMPSEGTTPTNVTAHFNTDGKVGIGTTSPKAPLHVGDSSKGNYFGGKTVSLSTSYADALSIELPNHTAAYVKVFLNGDWSSHSSIAYVGEYMIQNGANSYNEPGIIITEFDNTYNGTIDVQIVDSSTDTFVIQMKLSTTGSFTGQLSYHVMGAITSIS